MVAAITGGEDEGVISFPMQDESKDVSTLGYDSSQWEIRLLNPAESGVCS